MDPQLQEDELDSPVHKESPDKIEINGHNNSQSEIKLYDVKNGTYSSPSLAKKSSEPTKESMRQFEI